MAANLRSDPVKTKNYPIKITIHKRILKLISPIFMLVKSVLTNENRSNIQQKGKINYPYKKAD
jgi:hypothetical protein